MPFQIIRNDITKVNADAIVNTANPKPVFGGGTDSAIYEAAGKEQLLSERKKIGDIARGEARATAAFGLNANYIIHTVGPVWEGGDKGEFDILKRCYENSLALARELGCASIAFPLIATGVYGFPKDKALQIAMSAIQAFLLEHDMTVILVVFDKKAFELSGKVVDNIREYVDSNYVAAAKRREYEEPRNRFYGNSIPDRPVAFSAGFGHRREREEIDAAESLPLMESCIEECVEAEEHLPRAPRAASGASSKADKVASPKAAPKKKIKIDDLLASPDKTFQEKLFEIIDARGLTGPQVYKNYVTKQVFSKIQSDKDYHPNKYTAIALCLSLHLDIDQTQDLIGRAGWTLSPSSKADLVVKGCILNQEYNVVNINCILFDFDCPELERIK